ncbi:leucine-rich repeat domain-containing protein [Flammeovirga sp. OC4]|uniref:leucine-rich repeat domain-containing protein n=1 Tax=Flammeovirga sp. OC4 TaxID=1382345 RepID=UPI0006941857|nr:leucine-rich repeat domain-containing protein [Flammeovirga sp. OC4]
MNTSKKTLLIFALLGLFSFTFNNDPNTFLNKGLNSIAKEDYLQAISNFTMAISIQNDLAEAYYHRAVSKNLFGVKEGFHNSDFCLDFIDAMKYGYTPAVEKLYELGRSECFLLKSASLMPEKAFCIDISSQNIDLISNQFSEFSNLVSLNASNNNIQDLGTLYNSCPYIIALDLGDNNISYMSSDLSKLKYLYELNLSNNDIKNMPNEITALEAMALLNLRGNQLTALPKDLGAMKSLKLLDLSLNKIEKLPKSISELENLETLVLSGNPIAKSEIKRLHTDLPNTEIIFDVQ